MKILIVDDSRAMRSILRRTLQELGLASLELREAADSDEALRQIANDQFDLMLIDCNMPETTGIELLRMLRRRGVEVPVGFVSADSSPAVRDLAQSTGALFLLPKPFTHEALRQALAEVRG